MAQIDHSKGDEMATQEKHILAVKPDQQSAKLVYPGKRALTGETVFVDLWVK